MKLSLYKVTLNETGLVRRLRWNGGEFYRLSVRQVPALTRIRGVSSIAAAQRGWWWLESNNIHGMCLGTVPLKEQQRVLRRHEESLQPFPQCLLHDNELTSMMLSGTRVNSCQQHDLWQNPAPNGCCHGRDLHEGCMVFALRGRPSAPITGPTGERCSGLSIVPSVQRSVAVPVCLTGPKCRSNPSLKMQNTNKCLHVKPHSSCFTAPGGPNQRV